MGYDIVIASPGLGHDGATLGQRSLGGSETAALLVAKALAAIPGNHVTVFSPCQGGIWDNVIFMPIEAFPSYASGTPHDATIVSRHLDLCRMRMASKYSALWCHDLALKRTRMVFGSALWNVNAIYVMSEFQKRQYAQIHDGVPSDVIQVTRNGVDLPRFVGLANRKRDPVKLIYGSRPERGFEQCLNIMDILAQRGAPYVLYASWYENTPQQLEGYYRALWDRAAKMPNVRLLGALTQDRWHEELATARAMIYPGVPGDFREISCIAAFEAQACGTPIVAIAKGALPETIAPDAGILVGDESTDPNSPGHLNAMADAIRTVMSDELGWTRMHKAGLVRAQSSGWDGVAAQWMGWISEAIARESSNDFRRAAWAKRFGEHEATAN